MTRSADQTASNRTARRGFSLLEVTIVMTIMVVLAAVPAPSFFKAIEQSKLDVASANLRSVWNAQRFFFLENKRYGSLAELAAPSGSNEGLIDPAIAAGGTFYAYSVVPSADGQSFVASATHPAGSQCSGSVSVDQTGTLNCRVTYAGAAMTPSLEPNS